MTPTISYASSPVAFLSEARALALGYVRRIYVENATECADLLVKPNADLDGRFKAFSLDDETWVIVSGWLFEIDG
jgi:hypothetical protein